MPWNDGDLPLVTHSPPFVPGLRGGVANLRYRCRAQNIPYFGGTTDAVRLRRHRSGECRVSWRFVYIYMAWYTVSTLFAFCLVVYPSFPCTRPLLALDEPNAGTAFADIVPSLLDGSAFIFLGMVIQFAATLLDTGLENTATGERAAFRRGIIGRCAFSLGDGTRCTFACPSLRDPAILPRLLRVGTLSRRVVPPPVPPPASPASAILPC